MTKPALGSCVLFALLGASHASFAARGDITLLGSMSLPSSVFVSDVWGWVDPGTSREYAIIGDWHGRKIFIIDATTPSNMKLVAEIDGVPGFDVKVWDHYIYSCDGDTFGQDSRVIDIADPFNPVLAPRGFFSAHNIAISPAGTMFLESPGLRTLDLTADPLAPTLLSEDFGDFRDGHDATVRGNRLYDFRGHEGTLILDVTDPANPDTLGTITDPAIAFHHSGDATADGTTLLITDELAADPSPDITVWDISNPADPVKLADITDPNSTVHNLYIQDNLAYVSYYASGFKVIDITDPSAPVVLDRYDTSPLSGDGFIGAFGIYPFAPGTRVYVSDIDNGLFVFDVDTTTTLTLSAPAADETVVLEQNAPNPFNPSTTIRYDLSRHARVTLAVYDVRGKRVRTLVDADEAPGQHQVDWDAHDSAGRRVASGVYFYRLHAGGEVQTRRMVLLK